MKAYLLAAGLGTRLKPITDTVPKCLVPIHGRPLLAWWMDLLERHDVTDVLVNLHHLPEPVRRFARDYRGACSIHTVMETELLGSAGTLHVNRDFVEGESEFFILYADNLTDADLTGMLEHHRRRPAVLTMALFEAENPRACGIAELDERGVIVAFEEKPEHPNGTLANAGMFVAGQELFRYITPLSFPWDFGGDVVPNLVGRMNGYRLDGYLRDIGTHESLRRAEVEWAGLNA